MKISGKTCFSSNFKLSLKIIECVREIIEYFWIYVYKESLKSHLIWYFKDNSFSFIGYFISNIIPSKFNVFFPMFLQHAFW